MSAADRVSELLAAAGQGDVEKLLALGAYLEEESNDQVGTQLGAHSVTCAAKRDAPSRARRALQRLH